MVNKRFKNYVILAKEALEHDKLKDAEKFFLKALNFADSSKTKIDVLFELADINIIEGNLIESKRIYEKILVLDNTSSGAHYGLSLINDLEKGDPNYSVEHYEKAIELDPEYDRAYYYLAHAYDKLSNPGKAMELLKKTVELNNQDYLALNDIGSLYEEVGEYKIAHEYFEKSLEINPKYSRALFNMGVVLKALGDSKKALKFYYRALEESHNEYIYLNMSAIYIEDQDLYKAVIILTEGIDYNPSAVNLYYNRSCSHALLGNLYDAVSDLKKAIELEPDVENWASEDQDLARVVTLLDMC